MNDVKEKPGGGNRRAIGKAGTPFVYKCLYNTPKRFVLQAPAIGPGNHLEKVTRAWVINYHLN